MTTMTEETATEAVEKVAVPPPAEDPYAELAEDEPHPPSDVEVEAAAPGAGGGDEPADEVVSSPPTIESLQKELAASQLEAGKYQRSQQAHYEENKRLRARNALEDRMDILEADAADREEDEEYDVPEVPDQVVDPVGFAAYKSSQAVDAVERVERKIDERSDAEKRAAAISEITAFAGQQHEAFVTEHPDYNDAAAVVQEAWVRPMKAMGATNEQIATRLQGLTDNTVLQAFKERGTAGARSANQMMYDMALELGYTAPNGDDPAKVTDNPSAVPAPTKIQQAAARQKETTTLAATPGSSGSQQDSGSIKAFLKAAEVGDEDGSQVQKAQDLAIANVKTQLPRGASDDDALEAIATGFITQLV